MSHERLPKVIYELLKKLDESGKTTWVANVKNLLFKYGFGFVVISQDIGDVSFSYGKFYATWK